MARLGHAEVTDEEVWRPLRCNGCARTVFVAEWPPEWIDPELYHCGLCLREVELPPEDEPQLELELDAPVYERPAYDPAMAAIPF